MHFIYLIIEFLDELVFGVGEIALPMMRDDLTLSYTQIGLLLSLPGIIAAFIEPFIGILGDVWKRRVLIRNRRCSVYSLIVHDQRQSILFAFARLLYSFLPLIRCIRQSFAGKLDGCSAHQA